MVNCDSQSAVWQTLSLNLVPSNFGLFSTTIVWQKKDWFLFHLKVAPVGFLWKECFCSVLLSTSRLHFLCEGILDLHDLATFLATHILHRGSIQALAEGGWNKGGGSLLARLLRIRPITRDQMKNIPSETSPTKTNLWEPLLHHSLVQPQTVNSN